MELNKWAKYDVVSLSSMGIRMTPFNRESVHTSNIFELQATSAETNVLNVLASLGLNTKVLTKFVKGSPISLFIKSELRRRNIEYEGIEIEQCNPWGYRHQINIADSGFGVRGPRVWNDRSGEVGQTLFSGEFGLKRLFVEEGCKIFHISGLVLSLGPRVAQCCRDVVRFAKDNNVIISFDLNYRNSFWNGRTDELKELFKEFVSLSDVVIGNEEDFQKCIGIAGPDVAEENMCWRIDDYKKIINQVVYQYPTVSCVAITLRDVINANEHMWGAILWEDNNWYVEPFRKISVLDRIGGGDGFVGGLLYGIIKSWNAQKCVCFGCAAGALATTTINDYITPIDEAQIWNCYNGNFRIER